MGSINDHMYHEGALYMGAVAGIIFIVGFLLLMKRRFYCTCYESKYIWL